MKNLKQILLTAFVGTTLFGAGCSSRIEGSTVASNNYSEANISKIMNVSDLDGDGFPDVLEYKPVSYGSRHTFIFKEGYGPSRSPPEGMVLEFLDRDNFYKRCGEKISL